MMYDRDLTKEDCAIAFDPAKSSNPDIKKVFANSRATALWLGYRLWHLIDQYGEEYLPKNCVEIAEKIDASIFMEEAVKQWDTQTLCRWLWPKLMNGLRLNSLLSDQGVAAPPEAVMDELTGGKNHTVPDAVAYTRFIRPYLTGEKIAEYRIDRTNGRQE